MLHDFKHGTDFIAQDQPVLCASCHKSNALASVGGPGGNPITVWPNSMRATMTRFAT
jgi:putative intracellular protease/amidase